jgi:hypothetical protein
MGHFTGQTENPFKIIRIVNTSIFQTADSLDISFSKNFTSQQSSSRKAKAKTNRPIVYDFSLAIVADL